jgi:GH15 family glucan-1,4-alpha-glucosidase
VREPNISDYALIGDTRTAALCTAEGSLNWMCAPGFDSEPIFGKLIGGSSAGSFDVTVDEVTATRRSYRGDSAVLETEIEARGGEGRLIEGMVMEVTGSLLPQTVLIRRLFCHRGTLTARVLFDPKLGLPGKEPRAARRAQTLVAQWGSLAVTLQSFPDMEVSPGREISIQIPERSDLTLVMTIADRAPAVFLSEDRAHSLLEETERWWEGWSADVEYDGPYRTSVIRSLITLQLLTFSPSGAPVAAPTTSLPEEVGGVRNWDYRFSWPRDASIGLAAFLAVGKQQTAHSFLNWLLHASRLTRPRLKVLYTPFGKAPPREQPVDRVPGYRGSLPVRTGNDARTQHQLDVYGWVVDAAWLLTNSGHHLQSETWRVISGMADFVARHWHEPDAGIWEVRDEPVHYVHSKMMAWLCLDRTLRIAATRGTRGRRRRRWARERDRIKADIREHGFDPALGSYVRSYGSDQVDAALLILPVLEFEDRSARVKGTVDAVRRALETDGGLVYRYRPGFDGLVGGEGAFLPCSFWLVQALARIGRPEEAADIFGKLLARANDVGLFSEEIAPSSGEFLGNFPQAFTHATLVQAALSLKREAG